MKLAEIAAQLAPDPTGIRLRQAVVVARAGDTVDLLVGGSDILVPGVRYAQHVQPAVGDTVWLAVQPPDLWVIAKMAVDGSGQELGLTIRRRVSNGATINVPAGGATGVRIPFGIAQITGVGVSMSTTVTANDTFTINVPGVWRITAGCRWASVGTWTMRLYIAGSSTTGLDASVRNATAHRNTSGNLDLDLNVSCEDYFTAGTSLSIWAWSDPGSALHTATNFAQRNNVTFSYVRALL